MLLFNFTKSFPNATDSKVNTLSKGYQTHPGHEAHCTANITCKKWQKRAYVNILSDKLQKTEYQLNTFKRNPDVYSISKDIQMNV